jgi:antigen flippase
MGGASGITMLISMVRVKFAAVLIGTTGVGLISSFGALQGLIGTLAGLGIQSSGVREVAAAVARNDDEAMGRTVLVLRRVCWVTGLSGMLAMALLSPWLSQITFGHRGYTLDIAALGLIILFGNLSGGQMALIQGMRRIADMAWANVFGAALGTAAAIGLYIWLGLRGVVPALVIAAALQLVLSWVYARRIPVPPVQLPWRHTWREARALLRLGLVFMWSGLAGSAVTYAIVLLITQHGGVQSVGIYSAAFALSGMFVGFVLNAMGADYYPRLTAAAGDKVAMTRLVNEQTEIGVLLALPGLVATIALAPWILKLFYTSEFLGAVHLMQWFILGCLGRVISWPLGFVMLALGKGKWFVLTETSFNVLHLLLAAVSLHFIGIEGVAFAFFVLYVAYIAIVYLVNRHLIEFRWSLACQRFATFSLVMLGTGFLAGRFLNTWPATAVGLVLVLMISIFCLRGLVARVGINNRFISHISKFPGARLLLASSCSS